MRGKKKNMVAREKDRAKGGGQQNKGTEEMGEKKKMHKGQQKQGNWNQRKGGKGNRQGGGSGKWGF